MKTKIIVFAAEKYECRTTKCAVSFVIFIPMKLQKIIKTSVTSMLHLYYYM